jgi:hypothetical protein
VIVVISAYDFKINFEEKLPLQRRMAKFLISNIDNNTGVDLSEL